MTARALAAAALAYGACCAAAYAAAVRRGRELPAGFRPEAVVVLGAGLEGELVTPLLASRLDRALEVLEAEERRGRRPLVVASGGRGPDEAVPEAVAMKRYLEARGVGAERILCEDRSESTRENLELSRRLLPDPKAPVCIVTSGFHGPRAALLARRVGLRARTAGARTALHSLPKAVARESAALGVATLPVHAGAGLALAGALGLRAAARRG